ncbi:hypothetical protein [Pseudomonas japonica]|nr:hypothetical protein [Pseudomonas japonica]
MAKTPETPPDKGLAAANLSHKEMDWLFAHLEYWRHISPEYEMCRFMLAVARFTTIPLARLCRDGQYVGLLSQFTTYARPAKPGDPPRCSHWVFTDNPGAPLETERPLCPQFIPILNDYVESRGLTTKNALPDVCTLQENRKSNGMTAGSADGVIQRHRVAISDAARNDEMLPDAPETAAKLRQLTFSQVRRSARANFELAGKKPKIT